MSMKEYTPTPEEIAIAAHRLRCNRADAERAAQVQREQKAIADAVAESAPDAAKSRSMQEETQAVYVGHDARMNVIAAGRYFLQQGNLQDARVLIRAGFSICLRHLVSIHLGRNVHITEPAALIQKLYSARALDKQHRKRLAKVAEVLEVLNATREQLQLAYDTARETLFALQRDDAEIYKQARIQPRAILVDGRRT